MARSPYGSERPLARGRCITVLAALLILASATSARVRAAEIPVAGEYDIKAAFLVNFAKFVQWPADESAPGSSPIVIGLIGTDPFGLKLDAIVTGRQVDGHPIVVRRVDSLDGLAVCHILFIGAATHAETAAIITQATGRAMLTVGEGPGFTERGGVIEFFIEDRKVRFAINLEAANAARLKVSSHLAQLATTPRALLDVGR